MSGKKLSLDFAALSKKPTVPEERTGSGAGEERPRERREKKKPGRKPKPDKEDTYTVEVPKRMQNDIKAAAALSGKKVYEFVEQALGAAVEKALKR